MRLEAVIVSVALLLSVGSHANAQKLIPVSLGLIPIVDVSPIYIGLRHGFFKKQGLEVKPTFSAGGAAIVPAVVSGGIDIGYSNTVSLITAAQKGLPVQIIAPGSQVGSTQDQDHCFMFVRGNSAIRAPLELAGKTIAVNTVKNLGDVSTKSALEALGVDTSTLRFVEVPFPDMEAALQSGRVDATWPCEPFVTMASDSGQRRLVGTLVGTMPNLQFSAYFASHSYAQMNADVVRRFQRAMSESLEYARKHPEEIRTVTTEYAKVSPDVAKRMILPVWTSMTVDKASISRLSDISVKYGIIPRAPDLTKLVVEQR